MSDQPNPETTHSTDLEIIDVEAQPSTDAAIVKIESNLAAMQAEAMAALQRSQAICSFQMSMRDMIANTVRENHWVRFGDKIRPDGSECLRIRMLFGVDIDIKDVQRDDYTDEAGSYYVYHTTGKASLGDAASVPCFGSSSSRTKFFAKSKGDYVDPRDINPSFIAKMAWMECLKHGIRMLFGLDLDPEELKGLTGRGVNDRSRDFANKPRAPKDHSTEDSPEIAEQRGAIRDYILELAGDDQDAAVFFLRALTTFTASDGKVVKGKSSTKQLTAKQVANLYKRRNKDLTVDNFSRVLGSRSQG